MRDDFGERPHRAAATTPRDERGSVLLLVLLVLLVIGTVSMSTARVTSSEIGVAANQRQAWRSYYAADGAAQASFDAIVGMAKNLTRFPTQGDLDTLTPPEFDHARVTELEAGVLGSPVVEPLQTGFYQGLPAWTQPFSVRVVAETLDEPRGETAVEIGAFFDVIPVFSFAVLTGKDLEFDPTAPLSIDGRVHANGDAWLSSNRGLQIDSVLTVAGDVRHGRRHGNTRGPVALRAGSGRYTGMDGLDSRHEDWRSASLERWRGNVRSSEHGVSALSLMIPDRTDPHMLIEPGYDDDTPEERVAKLYYNAGMSIAVINGRGFDQAGDEIPVGSVLAFDVLYDHREQREMLMVEVDVATLASLPNFPAGPTIIYVGSFQPGRGIPEWKLDAASASVAEELAAYFAWLDELGIPSDIMLAAKKANQAIEVCELPVSALHLLAEPSGNAKRLEGEERRLWWANSYVENTLKRVYDAIFTGKNRGNRLQNAYPPEVYYRLETTLEPLRRCELGAGGAADPGGSQTWPAAWDGLRAPYEGGETSFAVKLVNAELLPDALTIVSGNPIYVQGDFNVDDEKPASIIADAVTILSSAWPDADRVHSALPMRQRRATHTTVNAALLLGEGVAPAGRYGGGVESLPRLLEDWSNRTLRLHGSLATLWESEHATGLWVSGAPVYLPPTLDLRFNEEYLEPGRLPPGTPNLATLRLTYWSRE